MLDGECKQPRLPRVLGRRYGDGARDADGQRDGERIVHFDSITRDMAHYEVHLYVFWAPRWGRD